MDIDLKESPPSINDIEAEKSKLTALNEYSVVPARTFGVLLFVAGVILVVIGYCKGFDYDSGVVALVMCTAPGILVYSTVLIAFPRDGDFHSDRSWILIVVSFSATVIVFSTIASIINPSTHTLHPIPHFLLNILNWTMGGLFSILFVLVVGFISPGQRARIRLCRTLSSLEPHGDHACKWIAERLQCPQINSYRNSVVEQGRKLIIAELVAMKQVYEAWKARHDMKQACDKVYTDPIIITASS